MSRDWQDLPERSNPFWIRTITWIALHLGRGVARCLLYPITAYFMLVRNQTLKASRRYLLKALGRTPTWLDSFRQYHTFAGTLLDRLFVLAGREDTLKVHVQGLDLIEHYANAKQGCLLLGSHLGSFEIIRVLGRLRLDLRVKALMDGEATPGISRFYRSLNPALHDDIIASGHPAALIGVNDFMQQGGMLALLGDRCLPNERRVACRFFDEQVDFPQTPILLAQALRQPVLLFFCLQTGWGEYRLYFEPLTDSPTAERSAREAETQRLMQAYVERLEHYCRLAPYNWFNFHDLLPSSS